MVRQSALRTRSLMCSKAVWCSVVHGGNSRSHSLVVSGVSSFVYSASAGRKVAMYLVSPRNPLTLVAVVGCGQDAIRSVLRGSGLIPVPEIIWPRKHNSVAKRLDFAWLQ